MLTHNGKNKDDGGFDWKDAICDAGITSAMTFFTALSGGTVAELGAAASFKVAGFAAAGQFFAWLAVKRGLVKSMPTPS